MTSPKLPPLSEEAQEARKPPPPEELVDALQDPVHTNIGKLLAAKPVQPPRATAMTEQEAVAQIQQTLAQFLGCFASCEAVKALEDYLHSVGLTRMTVVLEPDGVTIRCPPDVVHVWDADAQMWRAHDAQLWKAQHREE